MKVIEQSVEFEGDIHAEEILWKIEAAARNCYKSEGRNSERDTAKRDALIRAAVKRGHTSVLEHGSVTFRVICNRGVSHEWVRHRIGWSYSQESTRYCNYGHDQGITVIWPWYLGEKDRIAYDDLGQVKQVLIKHWLDAMGSADSYYRLLLANGCKPEEARGVLPNDLKTEIVCTANVVALRHFFKLRCAKASHPQIRALALQALAMLCDTPLKILFEDLAEQYLTE